MAKSIASLPSELLPNLFQYCGNTTGVPTNLALVCKLWNSLVFSKQSSSLWHEIAKANEVLKLVKSGKEPRIKNWYSYFLARYKAKQDFGNLAEPEWKEDAVHPIENCGLAFPRVGEFGTIDEEHVKWEFQCPILWENLQNSLQRSYGFSPRPNKLLCQQCKHEVVWVYDEQQLNKAVEDGHCVIFDVGGTDPHQYRVVGKIKQQTSYQVQHRERQNRRTNELATERIEQRQQTWDI